MATRATSALSASRSSTNTAPIHCATATRSCAGAPTPFPAATLPVRRSQSRSGFHAVDSVQRSAVPLLRSPMPRFFIKTYGCQMNERDSEQVAHSLLERGYETVTSEAEADVVLLNT